MLSAISAAIAAWACAPWFPFTRLTRKHAKSCAFFEYMFVPCCRSSWTASRFWAPVSLTPSFLADASTSYLAARAPWFSTGISNFIGVDETLP